MEALAALAPPGADGAKNPLLRQRSRGQAEAGEVRPTTAGHASHAVPYEPLDCAR